MQQQADWHIEKNLNRHFFHYYFFLQQRSRLHALLAVECAIFYCFGFCFKFLIIIFVNYFGLLYASAFFAALDRLLFLRCHVVMRVAAAGHLRSNASFEWKRGIPTVSAMAMVMSQACGVGYSPAFSVSLDWNLFNRHLDCVWYSSIWSFFFP